MAYNFISSLHYTPSASKMQPEWCKQVINYYYHNSNSKSLLHGKNIDEVEQYSSGKIDMRPFKKMYKSIKDQLDIANVNYLNTNDISQQMQFEPLPMIPSKLNSAIATIQKIPIDIWCKAIDALAVQKKKEDLEFLKNKPQLEADLQDFVDQMNIGKVNLGETKHSSIPFSDSPYGLDLNEPDELQVFVDLLYNLSVESSFETVLQAMYENKNVLQNRLLETRDQLKWGVSSHNAFESAITGLPDIEYQFPGNVYVPYSDLPDFSDRTHQYIPESVTVMQLYNYFADEIKGEEMLDTIINEKEFGYCANNGIKDYQPYGNFNTMKVNLIKFEVKSVDFIGIKKISDSEDDFTLTLEDDDDVTGKFYAQNTYSFYWLKNTKYFFKIDKLGFATRKKGQESFQGFSTNIYKSQEQSAVELSIPQNKIAQVAFIKMQHAILKSLPAGKVIDLKGMRSAMEGMKDEVNEYTMSKLIMLALEENIMIIDTEGFDGKNDGQLKPFYEIPGGVKSEVIGYDNVINGADARISSYTGINPQLTGQSANPEGLIGLQKLLISSSINSLNYINQALTTQYQKLFNNWAYQIREGIEKYPEVKNAIENMIGSHKVSIIEGLKEIPLHTMGVQIGFTQREEERDAYKAKVFRLEQLGVLTVADEYMLESVSNPKDRLALLAVKEKQFRKRQEQQQQQQYEQQQSLLQQQGQNLIQNTAAQTDGKIKQIYAEGDKDSKLIQLSNQLGISKSQMEGIMKRSLQQERGIDQTNKAVQTIKAKADAEQQKSLI